MAEKVIIASDEDREKYAKRIYSILEGRKVCDVIVAMCSEHGKHGFLVQGINTKTGDSKSIIDALKANLDSSKCTGKVDKMVSTVQFYSRKIRIVHKLNNSGLWIIEYRV